MKDGAPGTIVVDISLSRGLVLGLALALLVAALLGYLALGRGEASASAPVSAPQATGLRKYYVTTTTWYGDQADGTDGNGAGVCEPGYHFASLWEILDTSVLEYNATLGVTYADIGQGPASGMPGWVRTGGDADVSFTPGLANCNNWAVRSSDYGGSVAWPDDDWRPFHDVEAWQTDTERCDVEKSVWCVED